jgi:hypothetical protein
MSQKLLNLNTRKLYSIDYALSPLPNGGGANLTALIADIEVTTPVYSVPMSGGKILISGGKVLIIK